MLKAKPLKIAKAKQGAAMGSAAALDIIGRHGCALASTNASHLRTYARRRGSDAWDKAYAAGYSKIVATKCGRGFSGGRRRQKGR